MSNNNKNNNKNHIINKKDTSNNQLTIYNNKQNNINRHFNLNDDVSSIDIIDQIIDQLCNDLNKLIISNKLSLDGNSDLINNENNINKNDNISINMNNTNNINNINDENKSKLISILDKNNIKVNSNKIIKYNNKYSSKRNIDNFIDDINKHYFSICPYYKNISDVFSNRSPFKPPLPISLSPPKPIKLKKININTEINSIQDIIKLTEDYPNTFGCEYNIDMIGIHAIKNDLIELNNMIGMNMLKENIVDQLLYFIQKLHLSTSKNNQDFLHTVIYGPPGTGKTETAKIIGSIYSKLGILKNKIFKKVTRADLIAGYLGQTAIKTKDMIKASLGGVLFIDEAYALGNPEKRDIFAKECIDTLCEALSDHKDQLMVIIAGYEEDLNKCFFSYNQGLDSRFTWRFKIDDYNYEELFLIFKKKVNDSGWKLKENIKSAWFEDKMEYFKFFGRDMETLFAKIKIAHSRRVFCLSEDEKKTINKKDMKKGFDKFISNDEVKSRKQDKSQFLKYMYC